MRSVDAHKFKLRMAIAKANTELVNDFIYIADSVHDPIQFPHLRQDISNLIVICIDFR